MDWSQIWTQILGIVTGLFGNRNTASTWRGSVDGSAHAAPISVDIESEGAKFVVDVNGASTTLEAKPGSIDHADVYVNGSLQSAARLHFAILSQPFAGRPLIVMLEFVNVNIGGASHSVRFDHP